MGSFVLLLSTGNGTNVMRRDAKKGNMELYESSISRSNSSIINNSSSSSTQNIVENNNSDAGNVAHGRDVGCFKKTMLSFCGSSKKWIVLRFGMIFLISVVILCCVYGLKSTSKHKNSGK